MVPTCGESAHQGQTEALLQVLGLQAELPLEYPATDASSSIIQPNFYDRNFTDEWRLYMKDRMLRSSSAEPNNGPHEVVVHVRRGDVKPGIYAFYGKDMYDRYLPNSYYLDLIENRQSSLNIQRGGVVVHRRVCHARQLPTAYQRECRGGLETFLGL